MSALHLLGSASPSPPPHSPCSEEAAEAQGAESSHGHTSVRLRLQCISAFRLRGQRLEKPHGEGRGGAGWPGSSRHPPNQPSQQSSPGGLDELTDSCASALGAVVSRCDGLLPCDLESSLSQASSLEGSGSQVRPHRRHAENRMF